MFKAGACVLSVILKNRDMRDAAIETQRVVTCFIGSQHVGDMRVRHQARSVRMIWALDDDVVNPEPSHASPRAVACNFRQFLFRYVARVPQRSPNFQSASLM